MKEFFNDDKNLVIMAVLILGLFVLWTPPADKESVSLLASVISGLFGIAVGRATKNNEVIIKKEVKENEEN